MGNVNRINVVFLYAENLATLRKFYESAFDLGEPVIDAKWWVEYEVGDGSHLALHQADALHFDGADRSKNTVKFSFEVTEIQKFTDKLKTLGAKFHYGPRKEYGFHLAEFEDPEGNCLRLYEKTKKA
ncbi:MAG TPA: VOC family protein [Verrucomicrobiae bacterium]|nr:VOC family protein [Verrucomicrobiae bacterium]